MTDGETKKNCHGVPLKEHMDARLDAMEKATKLAADALNIRLEHMNEFRKQISEQSATFITRREMDLKLESIEKGRKDNLTLIVSLIAILVSLIAIIFK